MTLEEVIREDNLNGVFLNYWTRNQALELAYREGMKEGARLANEQKESNHVEAKETEK